MTDYDEGNVFARILRGEIAAEVVYEDDVCIAFRDVAPVAPCHVLVIPRAPIAGVGVATESQRDILGHLLWAAAEVARRQGLAEDGYRLVVNNGAGGGQAVFHLHVHLIGGRPLAWPPG